MEPFDYLKVNCPRGGRQTIVRNGILKIHRRLLSKPFRKIPTRQSSLLDPGKGYEKW